MKHLLFLFTAITFMQHISAQDMKSYSKFDFIPGNEIIYFTNFEGEAKGELPVGWNTNGSGEVVTMANLNWVKLLQNATFITDNTQSFSDNFSAEFDLVLDFKGTEAFYPQFSFGILSSGADKPNSNATLRDIFKHQLLAIDLNAGIENNSITKLVSFNQGAEYFNSGEKPFKQIEALLTKNIHVSMQVQEQRFRLWINEIKLFDVPNALPEKTNINQLFFQLSQSSYNNEQIGVYVSNIKVAKGVADTRNKLLTEGRFSTTGILFSTNSAEIKPESFPGLKEIADVLTTNPGIKVLIVGHTDHEGSEADNLQLSMKRSASVKKFLADHFGIDQSRLNTDGKGELQPVASNTTREGRSQNRRVEFIKL